VSPATPSATFNNEDLVLHVKTDFDPTLVRLDKYDAFIEALCQDREFQKEAIHASCRFLAGGQYSSCAELAKENFGINPSLAERYGSFAVLRSALSFPDKLACNIDLATGTGKSWVIYGIARILLAEGVVDRVLVLCPSLTIEAGLREKFIRLTADKNLTDLIPADAVVRSPEIKDASVTTGAGDICIENIHATFDHVKSSVRDSFAGKGERTLVLNDEAHHIYSPPTGQRAIKKWKEFLASEDFGFHRIVGFSGTCYIANDYFPDVISRYSLRQAMEEGMVKVVHYVAKDESTSETERFQKWVQIHKENQARYSDRKPLSIVVAARIDGAETLAEEFIRFLVEDEGLTPKQAEAKVLVVTSRHPDGVAKLPYVDRSDYPVEWIFSVSMLTEGWDVQNVFQIVPHEKRAFNSKLLIAQVLGRGLRTGGLQKPVVRVFNHSSWSSEIKGLVDEILEQERRLHSYPVDEGEHSKYHFLLHQLTYETVMTEQEFTPKDGNGQLNLFRKGFVNFESQPENLQRQTVFASALDGQEYVVTSTVHYPAYSVDEVVKKLRARLKSIDLEAGTNYARDYPPRKLRAVIQKSLERIGETRSLVSEPNLQHAFRAIGTAQRKVNKTVRIEWKPQQLVEISTHDMRSRSVAFTSFRKEAAVYYDSESFNAGEDSDRRGLREVVEDESLPKASSKEVTNKYWFKSPVNVVLATHEPERSFVKRLFEPEVTDQLEAWVKAPDVGFYEIAFSWRKGDHQKQGKFNPDFFIRLANGRDVLVVELKGDDDDSDENKAKLKYASEHFERVNKKQNDAVYHMMFVSPGSYDAFFQRLKDGSVTSFTSALQATLAE
jgi:type III restriction enzyme